MRSEGHATKWKLLDPLEFLARALIHIPEPNKRLVHFYGAYANRVSTYRIADSVSDHILEFIRLFKFCIRSIVNSLNLL